MCSCPLQHSFMKQFLASVNESDYITMRLGFITVYNLGLWFVLWIEFLTTIISKDKLFFFFFFYIDSLQDQPKIQFPQIFNACNQFRFQESCWYQVKKKKFRLFENYTYFKECSWFCSNVFTTYCSWYLWVFVVLFLLLNIAGEMTSFYFDPN